jgi:pilus assembly protein TadC
MREYDEVIGELLRFNDIAYSTKKFVKIMLAISLGLAIVIGAIVSGVQPVYAAIIFLALPFLVHSIVLGFLYFRSKARADTAELYLPNLLELVATNIKSGMTPDKALLYSMRGESGPFNKDLKLVTKESVTVKPLEVALLEISKNYNSELIRSSFLLISKGVQGGGNLSSLLEKTAQDIREVMSLKKEVLADVNLHALFLVFAAVVGAPLLFGTTSFLIDEISWISEKTSNVFFSQQGHGFFYFAIAAVALNAFFASLLLGTIREGRKRDGLKYLPLFLFFSLGLLYVIRALMQAIFFSISV